MTRAIPAERIDLVTEDDWRRIVDTNLIGAFACIQAALPGMRARRRGRILNVASDSAFTGTGSSIPYVVSKAALVSLTVALAQAVGPDVRVNAIAPGWMDTPWLERYGTGPDATTADADPLLSPDHVAREAVALVADDDATGQVVRIDAAPAEGGR
jgi:NAD(P)-dependent dehydrogenase (short-subunit alcohol dehydrogenase family)